MFIENQTILSDNLFANGEHIVYKIRHMHIHICFLLYPYLFIRKNNKSVGVEVCWVFLCYSVKKTQTYFVALFLTGGGVRLVIIND